MTDMADAVLEVFREEALELVARALSSLNRAANAEGDSRKKQLRDVRHALHTLKGAAAAVSHDAIKAAAHTLEDRIAELPENARTLDFEPLFRELEQVESAANKLGSAKAAALSLPPQTTHISSPAKPQASAFDPQALLAGLPPALKKEPAQDERVGAVDWLRVPPERVDQLHAHLGELVLSRLQQDELFDRLLSLRTQASQARNRERELARALSELREDLTPEVYKKLRTCTDSMHRGFGNLVENLQGVCRDARMLKAQSAVVSQSVEESIQDLRLMPLAPFFESFAKAARDAARRENKELRFHVRAEGAEVDRAVLTRLADPILHLVRNAVAHGLETPDARARAGKPREGSLTLEAWSHGTHAMIRVVDDGAGVDEARVREKARRMGITEGESVLDMLTHSGFSTREVADDMSGRGVGLDVVLSVVRSLDGTLELASEPGAGTTFTIRVPIAASTTMGLLLKVGDEQFAVMMSSVERVIRPSPSEIEHVSGRPAVRIDGEMVSLVELADLLGTEAKPLEEARIPVVVLAQARRKLAVMVSDIPSEHALVVRPFGPAFRNADLFLGGAVQADHSIVPLLSTSALFARAARATPVPRDRRPLLQKAAVKTDLRALVVDDSITMRTMLRNVLSAAGYQVTVAEDGEAALASLEGMSECHIVVTDLQMPRMDGIALCARIRARKGPYVPIIMVTSVDEDEEKSRALRAGADAYVVKASFEQTGFLDRVNTLVRGPM